MLFVLSLLSLSIPQLVSIKAVNASNSHIIWVPNNETGYEPDFEESYSSAVCEVIQYSIENYGDFQLDLIFHNTSVTEYTYLWYTDYCETYYDYCAVFSKGHDTPWGACGRHYELKDYYGNGVRDADISDETGSKHDFVFIWHCGTAHEYPRTRCYNTTCDGYLEYRGHCYAWTHDNGLALDGYTETSDTGSEVFLGFINASYNFKTETDYSDFDYGGFAAYFYYYLVNLDYTVKNALNSASVQTLGCSFIDSDLYKGIDVTVPPFEGTFWSRLAIYGNGDLTLP